MPFVSESGYVLPIDNDLDLTSFTTGVLVVTRSDNSRYTVNITGGDLASDGSISYRVRSGDFTVPGIYSVQLRNTTGGQDEMSDIGEFYVGPPL